MIKRLLNWLFRPKKYSKETAEAHYQVFIDAAWLVHNVFHADKEGKYTDEQRVQVREAYVAASDLIKLALPRIMGQEMDQEAIERVFGAIERTTFKQFRELNP